MAKIHVDCEDAILACEKALENLKDGGAIWAVKNLTDAAKYLKHKNRRLIIDTQTYEFGLISKFLPTE